MDEPVVDPGAAEAIRCADCARSDSLVEGLEPVDAMPLTAEAMAGFPDAPGRGGPAVSTGANSCARRARDGVGLRRYPDRLDARVRGRGGRGRRARRTSS